MIAWATWPNFQHSVLLVSTDQTQIMIPSCIIATASKTLRLAYKDPSVPLLPRHLTVSKRVCEEFKRLDAQTTQSFGVPTR